MLFLALMSQQATAGSISTAGNAAGPDGGAATPNVAAIVYNPAAIAASEGVEVMLDTQASFVRIEVLADRNDGIDPNTGQPWEPATAKVLVPEAVVGFTYNVVPERLTVGLAINDPFVGGGDYTSTEQGDPPPYTGHQRYHVINTKIITASITPAFGLTVIDGLHIGAGLSYVYDMLKVMQASDPLGTEGVPLEEIDLAAPENPYAMDTYLSGDGTGSHWGYTVGVFFNKFEKAQVGASYTGASMYEVSGEGTVDVPAALSTVEGGVVVPADVTVKMPLPATIRFYLSSQLNEKLNLGIGIDSQLWNSCCGEEDGDITIGLKNSEGRAIGAEDGVAIDIATEQYNPRRLWDATDFSLLGGYQANDDLWLGWRLGYNQNAVPDYAVNPSNLDFENVYGMVGARYKVGGPLILGLAYTKYVLFTREITDSAWNLGDGNARFSAGPPYKTNANGTYSGNNDVLGVRIGLDM